MRDLIQRRVPQYLAVYLGVAWGVVEFMSFLEERYALSPHLTDLALLGFALLIPSVVLFTYHHGRPGRDRWVRSEKIGIPLNLLVACIVLFLVFGRKELGAVTDSVVVQDETGRTIERLVPRASFRTRLALFNFDAPAGDTASAWLRYAMPIALTMDLSQNMFIDVRMSSHFREKLRHAGFHEEVNVPLGLKQSIASEQRVPYFTAATITRSGDAITVDLKLYDSTRGTVMRQRRFTGNDVLALSDEMAAALAADLELPQTAQVKDLPVAELLSASPGAFRHYVDGLTAIELRGGWVQGGERLEQAVVADPTFAAAWLALHSVYLVSNRSDESMPPLQQAMDLLYRLPERWHYDVKAQYYSMRREIDKAQAVARMKVELFPEDISGYGLLAQLQRLANDREGMVESYGRILELDPTQHEIVHTLGELHEELGDEDNALRRYAEYAERAPARPDAFVSMGDLHRSRGRHDDARQNYERALVVATNNVPAMVGLARTDRDVGRFDEAQRQYQEALSVSRTSEDSARALAGLASFYEFRGQLRRFLEYKALELEAAAKVTAPLVLAIRQMELLGAWVRAGQTETARRTLEQVGGRLQPPFDAFRALGEMQLELALEHPDEAERALAVADRAIEGSGYTFLRPELMWARGRIAELRGSCEQAITHYEESRALEPWDAVIHYHIGRCNRKLGRIQASSEQHRRTLAVIPFHAPASYELALTLLESGDRAGALESLRRAVRVWADADPAYALAAEAKARLRELEAGGS